MFSKDQDHPFYPHGFHTQTSLLGREPRVLVSREAYNRMWLYVDIAQQEVGWLGTVKRTESGDFLIEKVFLLKQEVSGVETELSVQGLNELAMELISMGDEGIELWNNMRFWGHSHVRMGTFASGTDERTMQSFDGAHPWFVRGIFNKLGRAQFTIFLYEEGLRIDDAEWELYDPEGEGTEGESGKASRPAAEFAAAPSTGEQSASNAPAQDEPSPDDPADVPGVTESGAETAGFDADETGEPDIREYFDLPDEEEVEAAEDSPGDRPVSGTYPSSYRTGYPSWGSAPYRPRPYLFRPDPELRREIEAEFARKVKQRGFSFGTYHTYDRGPGPYGGTGSANRDRPAPDTGARAGRGAAGPKLPAEMSAPPSPDSNQPVWRPEVEVEPISDGDMIMPDVREPTPDAGRPPAQSQTPPVPAKPPAVSAKKQQGFFAWLWDALTSPAEPYPQPRLCMCKKCVEARSRSSR